MKCTRKSVHTVHYLNGFRYTRKLTWTQKYKKMNVISDYSHIETEFHRVKCHSNGNIRYSKGHFFFFSKSFKWNSRRVQPGGVRSTMWSNDQQDRICVEGHGLGSLVRNTHIQEQIWLIKMKPSYTPIHRRRAGKTVSYYSTQSRFSFKAQTPSYTPWERRCVSMLQAIKNNIGVCAQGIIDVTCECRSITC